MSEREGKKSHGHLGTSRQADEEEERERRRNMGSCDGVFIP